MSTFIDANVIIKAFTDNIDKDRCRNVLNTEFTTDTLCLIEALHLITKIKDDKKYAAECIKSIFRSKATIVEIDQNILFEATKKVEKYNLNIFDLIHYIVAFTNGCTEFVSYNKDFSHLEIKRVEP